MDPDKRNISIKLSVVNEAGIHVTHETGDLWIGSSPGLLPLFSGAYVLTVGWIFSPDDVSYSSPKYGIAA